MFDSVEKMIGNTPLFKLRRTGVAGPNLILKLEQFNPGGSIKDRTALAMIRAAENQGLLRPSMRIIESSSGNTAIGLAMLSIERGYRVTAICDRHLPLTKRARLFALGADIVFLPETPVGMDTVELRIQVANQLAKTVPNAISLGQYSNPANPDIHYQTTGPEIWQELGGKLRAVVMAVGTCGTITGVGRYLKERDPSIRIIGAEPVGSEIFGPERGPYLIQGGGLSFIPSILDSSVIDEGWKVRDADAIAAIHELAVNEGWAIGGTGGLVIHVLKAIAENFGPDDNLVGIIPDAGERYLDTIYFEPWLEEHGMHRLTKDPDDSDPETVAAVKAIGCSLNEIPEDPGISLDEIEQRLGMVSRI
jgi:cystathionine beta-synthase